MSDLKVVAVVLVNKIEALVLNRPLKFIYENDGSGGFIGKDGPFTDALKYERAYGKMVAFAGREFSITMADGSERTLKDHWWQAFVKNTWSRPHADVESLKRCYVFYGGACIKPEDYNALRATYDGPVYEYQEYDDIISDMKKLGWTYDEWEKKQGISPSSPEAYYAEKAWKDSRIAIDLTEDSLDDAVNAFNDTYEADYLQNGTTSNIRGALKAVLENHIKTLRSKK